jgi:hypothetical protein
LLPNDPSGSKHLPELKIAEAMKMVSAIFCADNAPCAAVIDLAGTVDPAVDLIGQARYLKKAARFFRDGPAAV